MSRSSCPVAIVLGSVACFIASSLSAQSVSDPQAVPAPGAVRVIPAAQPAAAPPAGPVDDYLAWDTSVQSLTVTNGTPETSFTFNLTNKSAGEVTITAASGSCYCTVAKLPELPWKIPAGGTGQINVVMNLAGRSGSNPKTVTVVTDKGVKMLYVNTTILPPPGPVHMAPLERERNQKIAIVDRQSVFRGDCARCHAEPGRNQTGQVLFTQVCGVCHESERRASVVPDLRAISQETNAEFWRTWIVHGKPGSLMPAFSQGEGGSLTDAQIASLVNYLTSTIPSRPPVSASKSHVRLN